MTSNPLDKILGKAKASIRSSDSTTGKQVSIADQNYQGNLPGSNQTSGGFYSDPPERPLPRPIPDFHMEPWFVDDEPSQSRYSSKYVLNRIIMTTFSLGGLVFVIGGVVWVMSIAVQIFSE